MSALFGLITGGLKKYIGMFILASFALYAAAYFNVIDMPGSVAIGELASSAADAGSAILGGIIRIIKALIAAIQANV